MFTYTFYKLNRETEANLCIEMRWNKSDLLAYTCICGGGEARESACNIYV